MDGQVPAKFLQVGDKIKSTVINQIDASTPDSYQFSTWSSDALSIGEFVETTITEIIETQESDIMYFNGNTDIRMTFTQPIFVKMLDGTYKIKESYYAEIGESLIIVDANGTINEVPITDIKYSTEAPTSVYQLSCEPYDWFFVSGLLIHNK
jgi:hypothetical protein